MDETNGYIGAVPTCALFLIIFCLSCRHHSANSCLLFLFPWNFNWLVQFALQSRFLLRYCLLARPRSILPPFIARSRTLQRVLWLPENKTHSSPFTSLQAIGMLARAARPKLALAVPITTTSHALKSPLPISPSPISPTVRNTRANQRGFSTFQQPTFSYALSSNTKSILKKSQQSTSSGKKLQFREEPAVRCITPVPEDYHGTYVKMSRDDRRWGKGARE